MATRVKLKVKRRKKRKGAGKGSAFERKVCKALSRWVSGGKREDLFWRSSISGGRATMAAKRGNMLRQQAGDISSIAPEGHVLTDTFYVECKFYKSLEIDNFCMGDKTGKLYKFWVRAVKDAKRYDRLPMLIARENFRDTIVVMPRGNFSTWQNNSRVCRVGIPFVDILRFDHMVKLPFTVKPYGGITNH
jgi:hypothetical protein